PCLIDEDAGFCDALQSHALLRDRLAERYPLSRAAAHHLQRTLRKPDQPHAVMHPAGSEPALSDLEAASLSQQQVASTYAHLLEDNFRMAVRGVVESEHRQMTHDVDALRIDRHQDHRLLIVARRVGIGLPHEDEESAATIDGASRPPFVAVENIVRAIAPD